jgi:predicted transcriptional regulator
MIKNKNTDEKKLFNKTVDNMVKIFSALSNKDALDIFFQAQNGILSSTKTIKELGLTQKRYYSRLNDLVKTGLIHKVNNVYHQTTLGDMCYKLGTIFMDALSHTEHLELMDRVVTSQNLSTTEKNKVLSALMDENLSSFQQFLGGGIKPIGMVTRFEDLRDLVVQLIDMSRNKLYLASRYTDVNVVDACIKALNTGVEMYFIDGNKKNLSAKTQLLRTILSNPLKLKDFYKLYRSSKMHVKFIEIPFSFLVADGKYALFELVNPDTNEFISALFLESPMLARRFLEIFLDLYEKGREISLQFPRLGRRSVKLEY